MRNVRPSLAAALLGVLLCGGAPAVVDVAIARAEEAAADDEEVSGDGPSQEELEAMLKEQMGAMGGDGEDMPSMEEMMKQLQDAGAGMGGGMGDMMGGMGDMMGGMGGMGDMMGGMGGMGDMMGGMGGMGDMMGGMGGMPDMQSMMMGDQGMGAPPPAAVKSDVKFILCDACNALVDSATEQVAALRASLPNTKISEVRIDEKLEKLCDSKEEAGVWISKLDMVEDGDKIKLEAQPGPGKCLEECKTVEAACQRVMDEVSTDLVEALYLDRQSTAELKDRFCVKALRRKKGACGKSYPPIPEDREPGGDNFVAKTEEELHMDEINRKIRSSGMGNFGIKEL